ncbi:unnamed protein product [Closterium sp. NIES-64]|nr:unnamed protein product [Closterium sp. NIES-64]
MELLSRSFFNKRANCHFYRPPSRVVLTLLLPLLVLFIPLSVISVVTCHVAVTSGEEGDDRAPREAVGDWSLADEHHPRGTAGLLDTSGAAARRLIIDGTILADSQLQVLVALNAAWQLWPSNSNRSRRCDQWYFVQCNQQGFITTLSTMKDQDEQSSTNPMTWRWLRSDAM